MWPRYLADMKELENKSPKVWAAKLEGNFSVSKTKQPFSSIGPDHACEYINKWMKGKNGIAGISSKSNAHERCFHTAPILARMCEEYRSLFN